MVFVFKKSCAFHLSRCLFVLTLNTIVGTCHVASSVEGVYAQHVGGDLRIVGYGVQDFGDVVFRIATGVDKVPKKTLKGKCVN